MNALVPIEPAPTAGPHGEGHTVFSPARQAEFLASLQLFGNVRLACRAARVSAQTAYRQRRASAALARAWDAALLAARAHAEATLAERAIEGVEEAVFYHGEEVARRRRFDSRLLLAHLARLDRLEERPEVVAALATLDGDIETLREGCALEDRPGCDAGDASDAAGNSPQDPVPSVPPCRKCGGQCDDPDAKLTQADCQWFGNRLERFYDARPDGVESFAQLAGWELDPYDVEAVQMEAYEAGVPEWWLLTTEEELAAALRAVGRGDCATLPEGVPSPTEGERSCMHGTGS
ncbi:hypothetical protein [Qipengyuania gaetbuli]|uniref:hypothetical protein n=1 Tax=Qipengyuania gaetbuli TaxID=266952 RepID=UPI001CD67BDD|nr:hypothetical protein [Qipengyuania gaetbuli]MCA0908977.1 hypothetical protein [Qipengyuania gaetbuli]